MKTRNVLKWFKLCSFLLLSILLYSCSDNPVDEPFQSDDDYLKSSAINSLFSNDQEDDDNLLYSEVMDFANGEAVADNENNPPVDSLIKWGRRVTNVSINASIINPGDSLKQVDVTKNISGNLIIIASTSGVTDTIVKPFVQEQKRIVVFKRVGRRPNPRLNWRLYQYSAVDGETKQPQTGESNIVMNKVEVYRNDNLALTLNGPDFTANMFNARRFAGSGGHFESSLNSQVKFKVYIASNQSSADLVMFHWARNNEGHHRVRFEMVSEIPNGSGWDRVFEKTFDIFPGHRHGIFNGFISASTKATLYDDDPSLLSTTYMGFPYAVRP